MVVKRGDIIDALCRGLPDGVVSFGNEFQRFEQLGVCEGVKLYFNKGGGEGTTCTVGILVDASGTRSRVRQQLIGDKPLPSVLWVSGIVPLRAAAAYTSDMDGNFLETVYVGKDYIFFYPYGNGNVQWVYSTRSFDKQYTGMLDKLAVQEQLGSSFALWPDMVKGLIRETPDEAFFVRVIDDVPFSWKWGEGDVTLVGDAADGSSIIDSLLGVQRAVSDVENLLKQIDSIGLDRKALRWYETWRLPQKALSRLAFDTIFNLFA